MRGFTIEWNKEQGARAVEQTGIRDELNRLTRKIGNLVDAVADNGCSAALQAALMAAETRKAELNAELAEAETPAPRLRPNLADLYRSRVAGLREALDGEDAGAFRERIRTLIEEIRLLPCTTDRAAPLSIEGRGDRAAMLALGVRVERRGIDGSGVADQAGCGGRI